MKMLVDSLLLFRKEYQERKPIMLSPFKILFQKLGDMLAFFLDFRFIILPIFLTRCSWNPKDMKSAATAWNALLALLKFVNDSLRIELCAYLAPAPFHLVSYWRRAMLKGPKRSFVVVLLLLLGGVSGHVLISWTNTS